jgi:hypothetical protein
MEQTERSALRRLVVLDPGGDHVEAPSLASLLPTWNEQHFVSASVRVPELNMQAFLK